MADKDTLPPQPEPLKEGEVLPGQKKDKDWLAAREPAPAPEPLKEGEGMPSGSGKAGKHEHRWQGFRGGGKSVHMCAVCGKAKDEEVLEEQAPTPEPVEIEDDK